MTPLKPKIFIIAAVDLKGGLGFQGKMPWNLPGDLKHFQKITIQTEDIQYRNMVVMGRITWDSIPEAHRPLPGRKNVVITRNKDFKADDEVTVVHSIEEALKAADDRVADIFVIGGAKIYEQFMKRQKIDGIYLTRIRKEFKCDTFFPKIPKNFKAERQGEKRNGDVNYEFLFYKK